MTNIIVNAYKKICEFCMLFDALLKGVWPTNPHNSYYFMVLLKFMLAKHGGGWTTAHLYVHCVLAHPMFLSGLCQDELIVTGRKRPYLLTSW